MMISNISCSSLAQLLCLLDENFVFVLLGKHNVDYFVFDEVGLSAALSDECSAEDKTSLIDEMVRTRGDIRNRISPRYRFDERWDDLEKCLLLDGYRIEDKTIHKTSPFIEGEKTVLDDLVNEIEKSSIPQKSEIISHINLSDSAFLKSPSNFNGCLSHARISLETLVRSIAETFNFETPKGNKAWGSSLAYLREQDFIEKDEESVISSIYTFISSGSHVPIGFSEEEYVRFGRNLTTSICYYIIKIFNKH